MVSGGTTNTGEGPSQPALAEAALWVVRTRDSDDETSSLDQWLDEHPDNANAYAKTLMVWNELGHVLPDRMPEERRAAAPPKLRRHMPVVALVCTLLLCVLGWAWLSQMPTYRTGVGEQRIVTLDDGTRVTLNTDTEIKPLFGDGERKLKLVHGEALFDVAHNAARPFVVEAGENYVRALGTSFVVRSSDNRLDVILLSGVVKVDRGTDDSQATVLSPGERYRKAGDHVLRDRPQIEAVTAWRNGELVLDKTPLGEAVAEMNRYSAKPITLRSQAATELRLSGVFRTGESETFANTVGAIYGLKVTENAREFNITDARKKR